MFNYVLEMLNKLNQQDELFTAIANCYKKSFDSLVAVGFTEEQAIRIIAGQGLSVTTK